MITQAQIQVVVDKLVAALQPEKIILFGSYAYGEPNEDSDIDLLVIKDNPEKKSRAKRGVEAQKAIGWREISVDVLVRTEEELERMNNPFIEEILGKGVVLYG